MKKFILVLILCLYAGNVKAEKTFDVDMLYEYCNSPEYTSDYRFCLGFFRGYSEAFLNYYYTYEYQTRCYPKIEYNFKNIIERFIIMYKRNMFDIGESTEVALVRTITNLCPPTEEEKNAAISKISLTFIKSSTKNEDNEKNP